MREEGWAELSEVAGGGHAGAGSSMSASACRSCLRALAWVMVVVESLLPDGVDRDKFLVTIQLGLLSSW